MKYFLIIPFFFIIYSCADKKSANKEMPSVLNEYLTPQLDSFNVKDLNYEPSLQSDITLDTISIYGNLKHPRINTVFPKLSEADYPFAHKQIAKLMKDKKADFYERISEYKNENDSSWQNRSWDIWIRPMSMYQTDKVISFSFQTNREYIGMSTAFEYDVINYDLENKRPITLKDYFVLNTTADTSYLEKIIGRANNIGFSIKNYIEIGGQINFSFDDFYVYFYFDKYDIVGWGIRSVKKKYILDHIYPEYRLPQD